MNCKTNTWTRVGLSLYPSVSLCQNFHLDWCKQPDVGLPKPDLVVFLQLQLAVAAARGEFGRERYENRAFQERVLQRFHQLMRDPALNWKVSPSRGPAAPGRPWVPAAASPSPRWLLAAGEVGASGSLPSPVLHWL